MALHAPSPAAHALPPPPPFPCAQAQAMQLANALSIPAKSLAFERGPIMLPPALDNKMGHFLLNMLGFYSNKSQMLHGGQALYEAIKEQCDSGAMQKGERTEKPLFAPAP
jgi:hypothetical protein